MRSSAERTPSPGEVLDDYLLVEPLGQGGFATVYLAHQQSLGRPVALKVSPSHGVEGPAMAQIDHPNVVRVYDQRTLPDRGVRLLAMECVRGGTLSHVIERARQTPPAARSGRLVLETVDAALGAHGQQPSEDSRLRELLAGLSWGQTVCLVGVHLARALAAAHAAGVLHRDVKPANVLLAASGRPKLADFNVAYSDRLEQEGPEAALGGSLVYMPPEQILALSPLHEGTAAAVGERSDLYALGVLLWEMFHTTLPFRDLKPEEQGGWNTLFQVLLDLRQKPPVAPPGLGAFQDAPEGLEDLVRACLDPVPDRRPPSAAALAERFEHCLRPRTRKILETSSPPRRLLARFPLLSLVLVVLAPNAALSLLNVVYNLQAVAGPEAWHTFQTQVSVVNLIAYAAGLAIMSPWALAIVRALRHDGALGAAGRERAVRHALRLPMRPTPILIALWTLSGLSFPLVRQLLTGTASLGAYLHFGISTFLFGLLGAGLAFFALSLLVVRALLPRLTAGAVLSAGAQPAAHGLVESAHAHLAAVTAVPFASIVGLSLTPAVGRSAFLAVGLSGIAAFGLAFAALSILRKDLGALQPEPLP